MEAAEGPMTPAWAKVLRAVSDLPGVESGSSYGTAALRMRGQFLARLREDGETLVVKVGHDARDILLAAKPEVFFVTQHYHGQPTVLVRLAPVGDAELADLLEEAWRRLAPKRWLAERDAGRHPT